MADISENRTQFGRREAFSARHRRSELLHTDARDGGHRGYLPATNAETSCIPFVHDVRAQISNLPVRIRGRRHPT